MPPETRDIPRNSPIMESTHGTHNVAGNPAQCPQHAQLDVKAPIPGADAPWTISMDESTYDYNILGDELDPDNLYQELLQFIKARNTVSPKKQGLIMDAHVCEALARLIHSSNFIERAGSSDPVITKRLCDLILFPPTTNSWTNPQGPCRYLRESGQWDDIHFSLMKDLTRRGQSPDFWGVVRAYKEVVHHVTAAVYIFEEVVTKGMPLTEEIILKTHGILTEGIDIPPSNTNLTSTSREGQQDQDKGTDWKEYSGIYRRDPVSAGMHGFPPAEDVPILMRRFISSLDHDTEKARKLGSIDPIALAAKYCHMFVNIHPFLDGNGRMCRLILNVLLLKYGGGKIPVVAFGATEEERGEYLGIAANASMREGMREDGGDDDEDEEGEEEAGCYGGLKRKEFKELASYVLKHAVQGLRDGWGGDEAEI